MSKEHEIFEVRGDGRPPGVPMSAVELGHSAAQTLIGKPVFDDTKRSRLVECEVYECGDELMVLIACPQCETDLRVTNKMKRISYYRGSDQLSIEKFKCTTPGCGWRSEILAKPTILAKNQSRDW